MSEPNRAFTTTVPFGNRRQTSQFGQVKTKASVWFSVSVIALSAKGLLPLLGSLASKIDLKVASMTIQPTFAPPSAIGRTALRKTSVSSNLL
jgi:hypothetical protein